MNTLKNTSFTGSKAAGKFPKAIYWIEEAISDGNNVEVDFTINDEWVNATIKFTDLRTFTIEQGLNDYCFDYSVAGEHVQDAGTFDVDTYLAENLNEAVRTYLEPIGNKVIAERIAA